MSRRDVRAALEALSPPRGWLEADAPGEWGVGWWEEDTGKVLHLQAMGGLNADYVLVRASSGLEIRCALADLERALDVAWGWLEGPREGETPMSEARLQEIEGLVHGGFSYGCRVPHLYWACDDLLAEVSRLRKKERARGQEA